MPDIMYISGNREVTISEGELLRKFTALTFTAISNNFLMLCVAGFPSGDCLGLTKQQMTLPGSALGIFGSSIPNAITFTVFVAAIGQREYFSLLNLAVEAHAPNIRKLAHFINLSNVPVALPIFIFYSSPISGPVLSAFLAWKLYTGKLHAAARILRDAHEPSPLTLILNTIIEEDEEAETHGVAATAFFFTFLTLSIAISKGMYTILYNAPEERYDGDGQTTDYLASRVGATAAMVITPALALAAKPVANAVVSCTRSAWTAARDMTTRCLDSAMTSSRRYTLLTDNDDGEAVTVMDSRTPGMN